MTGYAYLQVSSPRNGDGKSRQDTAVQKSVIAKYAKSHRLGKITYLEDYATGRNAKRDGYTSYETVPSIAETPETVSSLCTVDLLLQTNIADSCLCESESFGDGLQRFSLFSHAAYFGRFVVRTFAEFLRVVG